MTIVISDFVMGILATVLVEVGILICVGINVSSKKSKQRK